MIPAVIHDPNSGQPVVIASLERQRGEIEKEIRDACSEFLNDPNWDKNLQICDKLNSAPYLCPFAIKEIRKQLKTKNPEIEILALQLCEAIIKNCPSSHAAVAQEDFMRYLVKVGLNQRADGKFKKLKKTITLKKVKVINKAHVRSQCIERALLILKMLAAAYEQSHLYPVFRATYERLLKEGIRFPETNKDESLAIFSPMHSSGAPNEFANVSALGSIPKHIVNNNNSHLPMIRVFIPLDDVTDSVLMAAQENAHVLYTMINAAQPAFDLIPELIAMLQNQQQRVVILISEGNAPDKVIGQALQMNDICNQVIEDAQSILNGSARAYSDKVDNKINNLFDKKDKMDNKDDNNYNEPSLEHSISISDKSDVAAAADADADPVLFALTAPVNDAKLNKKRKSKTNKNKIDLLNDNDNNNKKANDNTVDLLSMDQQPVIAQKQKQQSDDDLMGFLGIQSQPNTKAAPKAIDNKPTIFDPLEDDQPPPQQPVVNKIKAGNNSVLDVLTGVASNNNNNQASNGEPSPYQSTHSSSMNASPPKPKPQPKADNNNIFDTGSDPFAGMPDDPFADIGGNAFTDPVISKPKAKAKVKPEKSEPIPKAVPKAIPVIQNNNLFKPVNNNVIKKVDSNNVILDLFVMGGSPDPNIDIKPVKTQPKPQPKPKPKPVDDDDPFADFGGNAFDDPVMSKPVDNKQQKQVKQTNSNNDNPFDTLDNPFGDNNLSSNDNIEVNNNDNPFDALDNPFGDDNLPSNDNINNDNPFADLVNDNNNNNNNKNKKDDFMDGRDPFDFM